jgi:transcriptional regulator with PAS, ATPase and Fis domain
MAHKGVLFLDEIGDMSISLQAKLLHVLQSGEFAPLGSERDVKTDTWVIAATNNELEKNIKTGNFREDLYYRLNIIKFFIPPLRQRPEDIPPLIDYYIEQYTSQFDNKQMLRPSRQIMDKLMNYHWPGNTRELQNILKRFLVICDWDEIADELFARKDLMQEDTSTTSASGSDPNDMGMDIAFGSGNDSFPDLESMSLKEIRKTALDKIERQAISYVLEKTGWNRSKASKILKISYKTLLYKISDLNILPPE